jgi:hypothetical protein
LLPVLPVLLPARRHRCLPLLLLLPARRGRLLLLRPVDVVVVVAVA